MVQDYRKPVSLKDAVAQTVLRPIVVARPPSPFDAMRQLAGALPDTSATAPTKPAKIANVAQKRTSTTPSCKGKGKP
jgi:hypothetical protein